MESVEPYQKAARTKVLEPGGLTLVAVFYPDPA
jgi:hypothetical protein